MPTQVRLRVLEVAVTVAKWWGMIPEGSNPADFAALIVQLKKFGRPGHRPGQDVGWGQRIDQEIGIDELAIYRLFLGGEVLLTFDVMDYNEGWDEVVHLWSSGKTYGAAAAGWFLMVWWELKEGRICGSQLNGSIQEPDFVKPQLDCIKELLQKFPVLDEILLAAAENANRRKSRFDWEPVVSALIHERTPYPRR